MLICSQIVRALDKGWLRGAALDVFQEEPLPPNSLLWNHPQVIGKGFLLTLSKKSVIFTNSFEKQFQFLVTPHVAAMSRPKDIAECFQQNLTRSSYDMSYRFIESYDFSAFIGVIIFYRYDDGKEVGCQVDWRTLY